MKHNPLKDRIDLSVQLKYPTISWSSFQAFRDFDKDKWYDQYVLGNKAKPNPLMQFGIDIGEKLATDQNFLPEVPRLDIYEQQLHGKIGDVVITGHMDAFSETKKAIGEYKTSTNPNKWTQEAVDNHGQITMYCLLVWLNYGIKPEELDLALTSILGVETGDFKIVLPEPPVVKTFKTKRTMLDVLNFGVELKKIKKEMEEFVKTKRR